MCMDVKVQDLAHQPSTMFLTWPSASKVVGPDRFSFMTRSTTCMYTHDCLVARHLVVPGLSASLLPADVTCEHHALTCSVVRANIDVQEMSLMHCRKIASWRSAVGSSTSGGRSVEPLTAKLLISGYVEVFR